MKDRNQFKMIMQCLLMSAVLLTMSKGEDIDCNPIENCKKQNVAGIKVADPSDCHNYYLCVEYFYENGSTIILPTDQPLPCSRGHYFHINNIFPSTSDCDKETVPCILPCNTRKCSTYCQEDFQKLAYPKDCNKYYTCIPGQYDTPVISTCSPEIPYFNGTACTTNAYTCCDICTPYCLEAYVEVRNPYDCESYYLCLEANTTPTDEDKYLCEMDYYFDPITNKCQLSNETQCEALCH